MMWYVRSMRKDHAIHRIAELLDRSDPETINTSMRLPVTLREAAALAVDELGVAGSTTALTSVALRAMLEAVVMQAALDQHYRRHPKARPSLAELAIAAAELDGHPLANRRDLLRRAATEIVRTRPEADADDVLLWAEARAASA